MSEEKQKNNDWKKRELGALWRREGKNQNFLSGKIKLGEFEEEREISIVVFKNNYKDNDRQPDFRIYEDAPRDTSEPIQGAGDGAPEPASASASAPVPDTDLPEVLQ